MRGKLTLVYHALALSQIGVAIAIAVIVKQKLWKFDLFNVNVLTSVEDYTCLMTYNGVNLCAYMYVAMAVSLVLSIFLLFMTIFAKRIWLGLEAVLMSFGIIWWVPAAVTSTVYGHRANEQGIPLEGDRTAVWSLAWAEVGLFTLTLLLILWDCFKPRKGVSKYVAAIDPADSLLSDAELADEASVRLGMDKQAAQGATHEQQEALLGSRQQAGSQAGVKV